MLANGGRALSATQGRPISSASALTDASVLTEDLDAWPENLTFAERQALAYRIRSAKAASRPISRSTTTSSPAVRNISSAESAGSIDDVFANTSSVPTLPVIAFSSPRPPKSVDKGRVIGGVAVPGSLVAAKDDGEKQRSLRRPRLPDSQPIVYCKVGDAQTISARPAVLHFGGFTLNTPWTQTLVITNISEETLRIQILPPATPQFSISCSKKGRLPPGTQELIKVTFTADSWQYCYDSIKIHSSSSENILIPLHAYPTMNEVIFPPFVDLGNCPMGETVTKNVRLQTKVPLQFQFAIDVISSTSDHIRVEPLSGVVSASADQDVTITYAPTRPVTSELIINISVSQYGFVPIRCRIIGSCYAVPDPSSTRELSHIPSPVNATLLAKAKSLTQSLQKPLAASSPSNHSATPPAPSPPTETLSSTKPRRAQVASPRKAKALRVSDMTQNGLTATAPPSLIRTRSSVNPQDYSDQPLDNLLFPGADRKSQESNFLKQFSEYTEHEKLLLINPTKLRIGQKLLTESQVDDLRRLRDQFDSSKMRALRDVARTTSEAVSAPPSEARVLVPSEAIESVDWTKFFPTPGNAITDWQYRQQIVRDFQTSVSKAMAQHRVDKRIGRLKAKIAAESGAVETAANDEGAELAQMFGLFSVDKAPAPSFPKEPAKDAGKTYDPIALPSAPSFRETAFLNKVTLPTPSEYKLLGYPKFESPAFPHHIPSARPALKTGATEEYFDPAVASIGKTIKLDPSLQFEIPEFLKERIIPAALDVLRSSPSVTGVYQRIPQSECEPAHAFLYPPLPFSAGLRINDTITSRHKYSDVVTVLGPTAPTVSSRFQRVNHLPLHLSAKAVPSVQLLAGPLPSFLKSLPTEDVLDDPNLDSSQRVESKTKAASLPESMDEAAALLLGSPDPVAANGASTQAASSALEKSVDALNAELLQRQVARARKLNSSLLALNQKMPKESLHVKPLAT